MESIDRPEAVEPKRFADADLAGARFVRCDLSGVVMRAVDVSDASIDAPWLIGSGAPLLVNGVDVAPFVDAELNRRFPGRELRSAADPEGLRAAWAALERTWTATLERVASMPVGAAEVCVDGEWSFAQTLRHLVMATDTWLRRAVLGVDEPYHPIGQPHAEYTTDGNDLSVFSAAAPDFDEVLAVRAERMAMVSSFIAAVTADDLAGARANPWAPDHHETVLSCLHTILEEEWEHHRYAVRDLDAIDAASVT